MKYHIAVFGKIIASFQEKSDRDACLLALRGDGSRDCLCGHYRVDDGPVEDVPVSDVHNTAVTESTTRLLKVAGDGLYNIVGISGTRYPAHWVREWESFIAYVWDDGSHTLLLDKPLKYLVGALVSE